MTWRQTPLSKNGSGGYCCIAKPELKTQVCSSWRLLSTIKKGRHLCHQERELLGDIDAHTKFSVKSVLRLV